MNRPILTGLLVVLLVLSSLVVLGQAPKKPQQNFLSVLKEGQSIGLKESDGRYEIQVLPVVRPAYKVIEIGENHIVVENVVEDMRVLQLSIPVYSIRSIVVLKTPAVKQAD